VVQALYLRRADAFTRADPVPLGAVYTAGSPLLAADEAAVRALAEAGERLTGFVPRVDSLGAVEAAGDRVRLEVRDGWADYDVVSADDPDGPVLRRGPGREPAPVVLQLVRGPDGWRIAAAGREG
jgi:hypothetical protein